MSRAIGVDLGTSTVKVAEIEFGGRAPKIVGLYEMPRPADAELGPALQAFFAAQGLKGERVALGLGDGAIFLKKFRFPFGDDKKVRPAIQGEFEDELPMELDNCLVEFKPLGKIGRQHNFIAGLVPLAKVQARQSLFEASGVLATAIFSDVEALGQLALHQGLPAAYAGTPYAVCDIGHSTTKLAVLVGGDTQALNKKSPPCGVAPDILSLRQFARGTRDVIGWIQSRQKISEQEALNWLAHRAEIKPPLEAGQAAELSDEVSDEVKLALRPIVLEIYQTLQALHGQQSVDVTTLYVTGGIAKLRGLTEFLARELRLQVFEWPAMSGFQTDLLVASDDGARRFALAVALAHRFALRKPVGWLNFRRSPQGQRQILTHFFDTLTGPQVKPVVQGFAVALMLMVSYLLLSSVLETERQSQLATELSGEFRRINADLAKRSSRFANDPARAREIYDQERKKLLAAQPEEENIERLRSRSDILLEVSDSVPANAVLKQVSMRTSGEDLELNYTIELSVGGSDTLKRLKASVEQTLNSRSYKDVRVTELGSQRVQVVAKLSPEEVPYE